MGQGAAVDQDASAQAQEEREGLDQASASSAPVAQEDAKSAKQDITSSGLKEFFDEVRALERHRRDALRKGPTQLLRTAFGPGVQIVKASSVDGRLIFVVDEVLPRAALESLYECLQTDAFQRTEFARPDTRQFRHHVVNYNLKSIKDTEMYLRVVKLVRILFPDDDIEVYRVYTNAVMFGDAAFVHRDATHDDHVTVIVYPNLEWASEFGGETLFYDEDGEIVEAVEPKPGRLVCFRGSILHKGSSPSRLFWGSRYTTAFKFGPKDWGEAAEDVKRGEKGYPEQNQ
eukprot:TRINITY_DN12541_c0_g1_i1.p1 TRINITY_DN12541_c0_g1~~TRINITY_DN12541_c0_g1_i1.p1  ORF type:complete len:301 (-),score=49.72 TRINITY_DN12541_c0_g1_i1:37-897(-)